MDRVAVALGSNLPSREAHLEYGRRRLAEFLYNIRFSSIHETEPVGVAVPQGPFLNQVAVGDTALEPRRLLAQLLSIEREAGRTRPYPGAPRTLDLDLILHGNCVLESDDLVLPHPRFRERAFVLVPLEQLEPDLVDPVTGRTIRELRAMLDQTG